MLHQDPSHLVSEGNKDQGHKRVRGWVLYCSTFCRLFCAVSFYTPTPLPHQHSPPTHTPTHTHTTPTHTTTILQYYLSHIPYFHIQIPYSHIFVFYIPIPIFPHFYSHIPPFPFPSSPLQFQWLMEYVHHYHAAGLQLHSHTQVCVYVCAYVCV
jgi:hypothetical protein